MVLSAPTILRPQVQISSTPSMLFSICNVKRTKINEKEAGIGPYFKKKVLPAPMMVECSVTCKKSANVYKSCLNDFN